MAGSEEKTSMYCNAALSLPRRILSPIRCWIVDISTLTLFLGFVLIFFFSPFNIYHLLASLPSPRPFPSPLLYDADVRGVLCAT